MISHACFQQSAGQLRNRKSGGSSGAKVTEHGESVTFADVAGVDEAKEELEEIVVCPSLLQCTDNTWPSFLVFSPLFLSLVFLLLLWCISST